MRYAFLHVQYHYAGTQPGQFKNCLIVLAICRRSRYKLNEDKTGVSSSITCFFSNPVEDDRWSRLTLDSSNILIRCWHQKPPFRSLHGLFFGMSRSFGSGVHGQAHRLGHYSLYVQSMLGVQLGYAVQMSWWVTQETAAEDLLLEYLVGYPLVMTNIAIENSLL